MYAHLFQNPLLAIAWRFKSAHWYHLILYRSRYWNRPLSRFFCV